MRYRRPKFPAKLNQKLKYTRPRRYGKALDPDALSKDELVILVIRMLSGLGL